MIPDPPPLVFPIGGLRVWLYSLCPLDNLQSLLMAGYAELTLCLGLCLDAEACPVTFHAPFLEAEVNFLSDCIILRELYVAQSSDFNEVLLI